MVEVPLSICINVVSPNKHLDAYSHVNRDRDDRLHFDSVNQGSHDHSHCSEDSNDNVNYQSELLHHLRLISGKFVDVKDGVENLKYLNANKEAS